MTLPVLDNLVRIGKLKPFPANRSEFEHLLGLARTLIGTVTSSDTMASLSHSNRHCDRPFTGRTETFVSGLRSGHLLTEVAHRPGQTTLRRSFRHAGQRYLLPTEIRP